ncbi:MAG: sulfite exporter TauE/SafE family protein [Phormidesmis sp.]
MISLLIFGIGLVAGFVDAIAGGGGLIMLPGLLFAGLPVSSAIATNKLCGTFGALTSALKFAQGKQLDWRICAWMALPVVMGSYIGSRSIDRLPTAWAEPLVIVLIVAITAFVVLNPSFGMAQTKKTLELTLSGDSEHAQGHNVLLKQLALSIFAGAAIGFHDGFFGPGTGIFLVFSLLSIWPMDFLKATGTTKLLNFLANVTALITFALSGTIVYSVGIYGAVGVVTGSYLGASFATQKGAKFIRPIFVLVTTALVIKLVVGYLNPA